MAASSDEELSKEYIKSLMYAVPDAALMAPRTRPIKTYALGVGLFLCPAVASFSFGSTVPRLQRRSRLAAAKRSFACAVPVICSLWKEIDGFKERGIAALKAGERAKAYIYLSQYAMAMMHPKDGIATHPSYSKIDEGERKNADKIAKTVLERVEKLRDEVKRDFVEKVRAASPRASATQAF